MLKKRGNVWWIHLRVHGIRYRRSAKTADKRLAQELHDKLAAEFWNRKHMGFVPYAQAVEAYMQAKRGQASWDANLTRLQRIGLDGYMLQDIGRREIEDIKASLAHLAPATVNRHLTLLRAILNYAVDREWLEVAPRIKMLPTPITRLVYLTPEEVSRLLPHLKQHQREFLVFALATGLRMRNITHLEWDQVNLFNQTITIHPDQHKTGAPLVIPINDEAMRILRARRPRLSPFAAGRVFTYRGKPYDRVGIRALERARKAAGIEKHIHPHLLRHTFASWHVMNGTSLIELKELGGWKKLDSVMIYAHLSVDHLRSIEHRERIRELYREALK